MSPVIRLWFVTLVTAVLSWPVARLLVDGHLSLEAALLRVGLAWAVATLAATLLNRLLQPVPPPRRRREDQLADAEG